MTPRPFTTRRAFLKLSGTCAAHLTLMATPFPASARVHWSRRASGQVVAQEPFGRLERVGQGMWAFVSTPLDGDYTTVCNGGIIAGNDGILVVEAYQTPEGAAWIARQARALTGRWPSHVLVTHYHGDHTNGVEGFVPPDRSPAGTSGGGPGAPPRFLATETTRALKLRGLPDDAPEALRRLWAEVVLVGEEAPEDLDLGGRTVSFVPRLGHTPSDVTVEVPEERIVWCGDLVWNGMFPNYMDAVPSRLSRAVRAVQGTESSLFVPGHGPLASPEDMVRYVAVIDGLEETARRARQEGWTSEEAGERHRIPEALGEWTLYNPSYFQRAVEAWMREWG